MSCLAAQGRLRAARGRGPLDLALGDGLASFTVGDRLLRLGFSGLGDYSRERLGLSGSTAEKLARLARNLADRPLLREAVLRGAVSPRKAETIVPLARGDAEAAWVERAMVETVRALAAEVRQAVGGDDTEEEPWERIGPSVRPEARAKVDQALALAAKALGAATPKWKRVEALCEEYLGAHPAPAETETAAGWMLDHTPSGQALEELKAWLEEETQRWDFIRSFDPAPRPAPDREESGGALAVEPVAIEPCLDLARLDADLRRLRDLRALAREAEADEEAQTCARGEISFRLPARVASLLDAALQAAQISAGRFITPGEALELIAEHFIATWEPLLAERNTIQKRVLARDRGWCQVPGCSRAALHVHHVRFRSHDGALVEENLVSLCAAHHLHGVHAGYLRVVGAAPHRLRWSFRPGGGPAPGPVVVEAPGLVAA